MSLCVGSRSCLGERQEVGGAPLTNDSWSLHCASQAVHCILMHPESERGEGGVGEKLISVKIS